MAGLVREVRVRIETGKVLRIFTNDLAASAEEIAYLYKRRWAIELFFRWVKQSLKIGHFLGTSENAVRIQIVVALIAFVLLRLAHEANGVVESPLTFARRSGPILSRRPIGELLRRPSPPGLEPRQANFVFDARATRQAHKRRAQRARLVMEQTASEASTVPDSRGCGRALRADCASRRLRPHDCPRLDRRAGGDRIDRVPAGKEQTGGRAVRQFAQRFQQLRREYHITIPLPFALLDPQHHALTGSRT